jgi:hypothetical protein
MKFRRPALTLTAACGLMLAAASPAFAVPDPSPGLPGDVDNKIDTLLGMGMALVIAACVAGVLICAGKMALAIKHGEGADAAKSLGTVGGACVLVGSASAIVAFLV